jgi:hypothetical protein
MSKQISYRLTDAQYDAVEAVAKVMRSTVEDIAAALALQDLEGFELNGGREADLLHSLRAYADGKKIPDIRL